MYGGNYRPSSSPRWDARSLWRGPTPLTWTLIACNVLTFLLAAGARTLLPLPFFTEGWWLRPWTLLTWPLQGEGDPIGLLFSVGWIYLFVGSMERAWGTPLYARFFAATTALAALTLWLGSLILQTGAALGSPWAAVGPTVVAWALVNRQASISFFFIPLPAWAVAALGAVMAWFYAGGGVIGLFALSGCFAAYWYVTQGRNLRFGTIRRGEAVHPRFVQFDRDSQPASANPLRRWLAARQKKTRDRKLEEMFRRSGFTDDEKGRR